MHGFWASVMRSAMRQADRRRPVPQRSLTRLLAGEVAWAARQAIHPVKMAAAALVVVGVGVALGPTTPGPVLGAGWRLAVAVVLGFIALAVAHALLQRRPTDEPTVLDGLRVVVAAVTTLLSGTLVLAYLLAVVTGSEADAEPSGLSASLPVDGPVLAVGALLVAGVLAAGLGHRFAMPGALLFLGLGMVIGDDGLGWVQLSDAQAVQSIGVVALVVILFEGGLTTDARRLQLATGPGLAMATVGVGVTAGITALGTVWLLDVPTRTAWLVGAIVASTDAAAVFALVRRVRLPERVSAVLQIESGANDPVAVLLTVGLLAAWDAPPTAGTWLAFGAQQLIGGVAVGIAVGAAGAWLVRRVELGVPGLYPVLAVALAGVTYGLAVAVGASGFLAVYLAGIVLASEAPRRRRAIRQVLEALAGGAEVGLFLLLGLLVFPSDLPPVAGTGLAVAAVLVLVARPVATALSLSWFDFRAREVAVISWLGMRGAVPIVLATLALSAGLAEADLIFDVVFFVVLTSALVQGLTAVPVLRRLGLDGTTTTGRSLVEALPLDDADIDVVEVRLDAGSPLVGRELRACTPPEAVLVTAVLRDDRVLLPRGSTRLLAGDRLVVTTTDRRSGMRLVDAWAGGAAGSTTAD